MKQIVLVPRSLLKWTDKPGEKFRQALKRVSKWAKDNDVVPQAAGLVLDKTTGIMKKEKSEVDRNESEVGRNEIETDTKKYELEFARRMETLRIRKEEAATQKQEAEATIATIEAFTAELKLKKELDEAGMILYRDDNGKLMLVAKPDIHITPFRLPDSPDSSKLDSDKNAL